MTSLQDFHASLEGYEHVPNLLVLIAHMGCHVRYAYTSPSGQMQPRTGGILTRVDPGGRYMQLKNPNATGKQTWSVQLMQKPDGTHVVQSWDSDDRKKGAYETMDIWVKPRVHPNQKDALRANDLLRMLDDGVITITKRPE